MPSMQVGPSVAKRLAKMLVVKKPQQPLGKDFVIVHHGAIRGNNQARAPNTATREVSVLTKFAVHGAWYAV